PRQTGAGWMSLDRGGGPESSKSSWFSTRFYLIGSPPAGAGPFPPPTPRWLAQRDHAPEDVSAVLARLIERGLLNDADYAVLFTRSRATTRGMSRRRI